MCAVVDVRHSPPAAAHLASWASALTLDDLPEEVRAAAREHVLDTLGCGLAALGLGEGTAGWSWRASRAQARRPRSAAPMA
jgi:MmgE/PrpD N-terminal domain